PRDGGQGWKRGQFRDWTCQPNGTLKPSASGEEAKAMTMYRVTCPGRRVPHDEGFVAEELGQGGEHLRDGRRAQAAHRISRGPRDDKSSAEEAGQGGEELRRGRRRAQAAHRTGRRGPHIVVAVAEEAAQRGEDLRRGRRRAQAAHRTGRRGPHAV